MSSITELYRRRTLHVVDADNLTGGPTEHDCVARQAADAYRLAAGVRRGDLIVVGSDRRSAAVTAFAWAGVNLVNTTGTDAVDRALIERMDAGELAGRFGRVSVGSGDGIFADAVAAVRQTGVTVDVVAPVGAVSWRLYQVAGDVRLVQRPDPCRHDGCRLAVGRSSVAVAA
jgi:hypothetical protein